MESVAHPLMWIFFAVFVLIALAVDLLVLRGSGPHKVTSREALLWSFAWISLALIFNLLLWLYLESVLDAANAKRIALEFLTGYLVEKSLSIDNIFVFLMLFNYFAVPEQYQQRALIYGVLGAIVLRAILIFLGAALLQNFHWLIYLFGLILLISGLKMLWAAGQKPNLENNPIMRWLSSHLTLTRSYHGQSLWIVENGKRIFTPLFLVLIMIGVTDLIFAVDSIPAIFAITDDPFIVLTSNVFAVLGLRALYFLLADMADRFHLLAYGLALVLIFIGGKMLLMDIYKIPITYSLLIVGLLIMSSMLLSLWLSANAKDDNNLDRPL